jgi:hypothetical protein
LISWVALTSPHLPPQHLPLNLPLSLWTNQQLWQNQLPHPKLPQQLLVHLDSMLATWRNCQVWRST